MVTAPRAPIAAPADALIWKPFLARAVLSGVFGLVTVFWREPTTAVLSSVGGLYLLADGTGHLWTHRRMGRRSALVAALTTIGGGLLLCAGIMCLVLVDDRAFALAGGTALAVAGVAELIRGLTERSRAAARDLVVAGAIGLVTGGTLPFVVDLGPQALLGVSGGGALLTAVALGIAALSYRHDSAVSASAHPSARGERDTVN